MARVLLGVTGGIAAYKACELLRLLVRAGHEVTPLLTPDAERFVTRAHVRGAGAPGGAARPLPAPRRGGPARDRAALREHAGEAGARPGRQRPHAARARLPRPGARRAGDERAHVGAPGDPGERRACSPSAAWSSSGPSGRAGRGRARAGPDDRAGGDLRARPGAARRRRARSPANGSSSAPGARGSRSTSSATSATARAAGWASPLAREASAEGPTSRSSPRTSPLAVPAGIEVVAAPTAADLAREMLARADADVIVMAAAVADYRPANPEEGKASEGQRDVDDRRSSRPSDVLAELGRRRRERAGARGLRRGRGRARSRAARGRSSPTSGGTSSSTTTYLVRTSDSSPRTTSSSSSLRRASARSAGEARRNVQWLSSMRSRPSWEGTDGRASRVGRVSGRRGVGDRRRWRSRVIANLRQRHPRARRDARVLRPLPPLRRGT